MGRIFIRVVRSAIGGWGPHQLRPFPPSYAERPKFPEMKSSRPKIANRARRRPVDDVEIRHGLPPEQAANEMTLPNGFKSQRFFAGERTSVQAHRFLHPTTADASGGRRGMT